jgi:integrase
MARQIALPPTLAPRLICRLAAAAYVSVSPTTFDQMVTDGRMPPPKILGERRRAWDVRALDVAVDNLPVEGEATMREDESWGDIDAAYAAHQMQRQEPKKDARTIEALIAAYMRHDRYRNLRQTTKAGYSSRLETLRTEHGHRTVAGLTEDRINTMLRPYDDRQGQKLALLKMLRVLIAFAIRPLKWLTHDPSKGIKRPKGGEIRSWTDDELARYEARWPIGTKQRTAYAIMLYVGTARVDAHAITWPQFDEAAIRYARNKTGVPVLIGIDSELKKSLAGADRSHVTIINTEYGRPFTVDGFSGFMRDAIRAAGLPLDCKPHGLRKTLGRKMADAGCTAHQIMAALGHTTLAEAERYTRDADRRRNGLEATRKLEAARSANVDEDRRFK